MTLISNTKISLAGLLIVSLVFLAGCGEAEPEIIQATGKVTIDGEPLNCALVSFVPMADGMDSSSTATGLTDEDGNFTLSFYSGPGVTIGLNKITIVDEPTPDGGRSLSQEGDRIRQEHQAKFKNRPIPSEYASIAMTPLSIEVTADKKEYLIEIKR